MPEKSGENDNEAGLTKPLRRWRKSGDLEDLRMRAWRALRAAETVLYDEASSRQEVLSAVRALTQATHAYRSILEMTEFEERFKRLEHAAFGLHSGEVATNGEGNE